MNRYYWSIVLCISSYFTLWQNGYAQDLKRHELVYDWSALGSGCRGGIHEMKGNVALTVTPQLPPSIARYRLRFEMGNFRLQSPVPKDQGRTNLEFARDCAIRVAVNPWAGKKIRNVEVYTAYSLTKPLEADMRTLAGLTLGMNQLGLVRMDFAKSEKFSELIKELNLTPGSTPDSRMPETKCGQAKLVGIDLLLYVNRPEESAVVDMTLADPKVVDLMVDLEECEGR